MNVARWRLESQLTNPRSVVGVKSTAATAIGSEKPRVNSALRLTPVAPLIGALETIVSGLSSTVAFGCPQALSTVISVIKDRVENMVVATRRVKFFGLIAVEGDLGINAMPRIYGLLNQISAPFRESFSRSGRNF